MKKHYLPLFSWLVILLLGLLIQHLTPTVASALTSKVVLKEGGSPALRDRLGEHLTSIVNSLERKNWADIRNYCTAEGLKSLQDLVQRTGCRNVYPLYETRLLSLPNDTGYEVRDIKVQVEMGETKGVPYQYLVFTITPDGLLSDVRFAMEQLRYRDIIKKGIEDFVYRQPIVQFLEIFRTAYNRKDLDYLRKVYSNDALIIVGRVLKKKPHSPDYLETSTLSRKRIKFIKLKKHEYIERLDTVFQKNAFVEVRFDSIDIKRSPDNPYIYGVMLKQYWRSSTYSDSGYLFLMLDFSDINAPLIHVRSWQPERFSDGSVVNLGNFVVVAPARKDP